MSPCVKLDCRFLALSVLVCCLVAPALAVPVVFTTNTTIGASETQYDGQDMVVRGCTVTINGAHSFNSLSIERSTSNQPGVVTHAAGLAVGLQLTIATNLTVQGVEGSLVASRIDVAGCGYAAGTGPGAGGSAGNRGAGGGHGGIGGASATGAAGGVAYGSWLAPIALGSGGGGMSDGGAGGGAVRLNVLGTLTVNGQVSANGSTPSSAGGGGGAGGSVYVTAGTFTGTGSISANGGAKGSFSEPGGGAGGRIALVYGSSTFSGSLSAIGGLGSANGGAGTIYRKQSSASVGSVVISNGGTPGGWTPLASPEAFDLTISGNAMTYPTDALTLRSLTVNASSYLTSPSNAAVTLSVQQAMTVAVGGYVTVSARGYDPGAGPGAGGFVGNRGAGGGHGGNGGNAATGAVGGTAYGALTTPNEFGSGGGGASDGGRGGGVLHAAVGGTLTVDGELSADGGNAPNASGGGGAGGSLLLTVGTLAGAGTITANGGNRGAYGETGGGGGGRVAVYYATNQFTGTLSAYGGGSSNWGGAGTVYTKGTAQPRGTIWLNNNAHSGAATPLGLVDGHLNVANAAWVVPAAEIDVAGNLAVGAGGLLTHLVGGATLQINVAGSADVYSGGAIAVDGKGYGPQSGPGAGGYYANRGSGAGHGGRGGNNAYGGAGGVAYGSEDMPSELGSGGGGVIDGGTGGGVIHLVVDGPLTVVGQISANGTNATDCSGGGGSGGSIWIETPQLAGAGTITATGGAKGCFGECGGGGGGRIAIYTCNRMMDLSHITAWGGTGWEVGSPGTVFFGSSSIDIAQNPVSEVGFIGDDVAFTVTASGSGMLSYRWRKDGVELQDDGHFSGVHTALLLINDVTLADQGEYDVWLVDDCGPRASEAAALTVARRGDLNHDGVIDSADLIVFAWCCSGPDVPLQPDCVLADLDQDHDADLVDFAALQIARGTP